MATLAAGQEKIISVNDPGQVTLTPGGGGSIVILSRDSSDDLPVPRTITSAETITMLAFSTLHFRAEGSTATYEIQSPVSGGPIPGAYATTGTLETAYPAAENLGRHASVGTSAPYTDYVSDGSAWVAAGGLGTVQTVAGISPTGIDIPGASLEGALAPLRLQSAQTIFANLGLGTDVMTGQSLSAIAAAIQPLLEPSSATVPMLWCGRGSTPEMVGVSTTKGLTTSISIPAGYLGTKGVMYILVDARTVASDGTTAAISVGTPSVYINHTDSSGSNELSAVTMTTAQYGMQLLAIIRGNGADQTSVIRDALGNTPYSAGIGTSSTNVTKTLATSASWNLNIYCTTGASDRIKAEVNVLVVNPDGNLGGTNVPVGTAVGQSLVWGGSTWSPAYARAATTRGVTTSGNFQASDAQAEYVTYTHASSAGVITVPNGTNYALGDVLAARQGGAAAVSVAAGAGHTINSVSGALTATTGQGQRVRLSCIDATPGANVWEYL